MKHEMVVDVRDVQKRFRYGVFFGFTFKALDGVSLYIENKPVIYTVAGESGSGKTTLARVILGMLKPERGYVLYRGRDIYRLSRKEIRWFRKEVQAIFQNPYASFNPLRKVYSYLLDTALNLAGAHNKEEAQDIVARALEIVGLNLDDVINKTPSELSGGQLQRVAIARALIPKPRLIVADEPVSMLDASLRVNILNIFKEAKERMGVSFFYITHDLSTAYYISDIIAIMYRGWIIEKGPIEGVMEKPSHPYTQMLIESVPEPDLDKREKWLLRIKLGGIEEREFIEQGCKFRSRCPFAFEKCSKEPPEFKLENGVAVRCWLYEDRYNKAPS